MSLICWMMSSSVSAVGSSPSSSTISSATCSGVSLPQTMGNVTVFSSPSIVILQVSSTLFSSSSAPDWLRRCDMCTRAEGCEGDEVNGSPSFSASGVLHSETGPSPPPFADGPAASCSRASEFRPGSLVAAAETDDESGIANAAAVRGGEGAAELQAAVDGSPRDVAIAGNGAAALCAAEVAQACASAFGRSSTGWSSSGSLNGG